MKHLKTIFACLLMAVLSIGQVWGAEGDELYSGDFTSVSAHGYTQNKTFTLSEKSFKSSVSQVNSSVFYLGTNTTNTNKPKGVLNNNSDFSSVVTALKAENATYNTNYETASAYALLLSNSFSTVGNIKYSWAGANGAGTAYIFADSGSGLVKLASTSVSNGTTTSGNIEYSNTSAGGMSFNSLVFVFLPNSNDKNIRLTSLVIKEGKASGGNPTCATPTFSPAAGNVVSGQTVTIASATEGGASIYYTMGADPADPTASSTPYTTPISITGNTTIKAIAIKDGYDNSSVATATYTALTPLITMDAIYSAATTAETTATDVAITFNNWVVSGVKGNYAYVTDNNLKGFIINQSGHGFVAGNVLSGTAICKVELYSGAAKLSALTSTTEGLTVTTGGTAITQVLDDSGIASLSGANTGSVIKINGECTKNTTTNKYYIAGVQLWNNLFSYTNPVEGKNYHCTGVYYYGGTTYGNEIMPRSNDDIEEIPEAGAPEAPTFSPAAGTYTEVQNVTLSCATDGATIYYTTNGDTPDDTSTPFTSAISVDEDMTIKAIAYKAGVPSTVTSAIYTINLPEDENVRKTWNLATDSYVKDPEPTASLIQWTATYVSMTNEKTGTETGVNNYIPTTRTSTRFYGGNRLTITPSGKQLTTIVFTATSNDYATAFANSIWTNATASASGSTVTVTASGPGAVVASVGGTCGFTAVQVNYTDVAAKTVTITTPSNGTLVVKNAGVAISSGDAIAVGTTLTIVATPDDGYTLGSVSVVDADEDPVTVTENAFVVPSKNVTVSATFNVDVTPDASLTLWENGNEVAFGGSHKQNDHVTLPTSVTHNCANRVFVGWSAVEVAQTDVKPSYFEPGADFVLSAEGENTLYAVYAAVVTPAGYEKLASDEFETTATYVIGAEQASGNTTMWYFSSYSNTDVNINWGVMTDDPATTAPVVFTLSGTANALVAQDASGNYLTGLTTGKFKMSTNSTTITLSNAGIIGSTESYVLRHNYNGGNGGLRWYNGTTGTSAYFYKVIAAVYNKYSTTCDAAPATLVSIAISGDASVLEYTAGQHFDPTGLVVTGTYSDASSAPITEGIDWTFAPDPLTEGITSVSVTATVGEISSDAVVVNGLTVGAAPAPTSGNVVIIAEYDSKFYAMTNSLASGALAGVEVEKDGSKIVVASQDDKDAIQWTATVDGDNTTLKDANDKYIKGGSNASLSLEDDSYNWNWNAVKSCYISSAYTTRGLFFSNSGNVFKGYALTNLEATGYAAIEVIEIDPANIVISSKVNPELAYTPASDEITVGDAWSAPSLGYVEGFDGLASISYESSNEAVATVSDAGVIALAGGTGTATITATFGGNTNYLAGSATYTITVNAPAPVPTGTTYTKVTSTENITDGEYLIVYEGDATHAAMAFNGSLDNIDQSMVGVAVTINEGVIAGTTAIDAATFTIDVTAGTLQSASGYYIGRETNDNGMDKSTETAYTNTFAISEGNAVITGAGNCTLRYNYSSDQLRFRYYKSGQQAIQLYKKDTPTPPTPVYTEVRTGLNAGDYYTMCLDKAVTAVQGGSIWRVVSKADGSSDIILEEVTGNLDAGRPYIFLASASTLEVAYTGDAVGAPITEGNNGLVGSFEKVELAQSPNTFIIYNNALYYVNSEHVYVGAYRAYLNMLDVPDYSNANLAPGRRRVTMAAHGPQTATGIEDLNASEKPMKMMINGQIFILRGEKMYDTTGRLVK